ncbi:hypothetical protein EVAR_171_1 [Eumeta japonica]|uniref:Uncharacterized protein n=1 Tax=Eumeta variegata TaxID=151549 RepID=A0A4C1S8N9_EUMVA|nr:hypothetical protein EVAR_171_1 [Eumeta japonica]
MSETNCVSRSACNSKGSMIVVSNRLPFVLRRNEKTGELERKASLLEKIGHAQEIENTFTLCGDIKSVWEDVLKNSLNKDTKEAIIKKIPFIKDCFTSAPSFNPEIKVTLSLQAVNGKKQSQIGASICGLSELLQDMLDEKDFDDSTFERISSYIRLLERPLNNWCPSGMRKQGGHLNYKRPYQQPPAKQPHVHSSALAVSTISGYDKTKRQGDIVFQQTIDDAESIAVAPVVIRGSGIWVGWPGLHLQDPNEPIPESDPKDKTPTAGLLSKKLCPHRQNEFFHLIHRPIAIINHDLVRYPVPESKPQPRRKQNRESRLGRIKVEKRTKVEIECGTKIRIKSVTGIGMSSAEIRIEIGTEIKSGILILVETGGLEGGARRRHVTAGPPPMAHCIDSMTWAPVIGLLGVKDSSAGLRHPVLSLTFTLEFGEDDILFELR